MRRMGSPMRRMDFPMCDGRDQQPVKILEAFLFVASSPMTRIENCTSVADVNIAFAAAL